MQINFNYITGQGISFEEQLEHLFENYIPKGDTIRLVFFGNPMNRAEYLLHEEMIKQGLSKKFGQRPPVFTYVAQPPIEKAAVGNGGF
jgi:hypothetical protein